MSELEPLKEQKVGERKRNPKKKPPKKRGIFFLILMNLIKTVRADRDIQSQRKTDTSDGREGMTVSCFVLEAESTAARFRPRSCTSSPGTITVTHMFPSHRICTQSQSSWGQSALVSGAGVLVSSDGNQLQDPLSSSPIHPLRSKINQDQVVVCST